MKKALFSLLISTFAANTLIATPQAIVFDFGGVLTGEPNREAVVNFIQKSFDLSPDEYEKLNQEKRLALKQGITDEEFWLSYAAAKGIQLPNDWSQSLTKVMKEAIGVNPQMYLLVEELRQRNIPVGLLSNIDERLAKLVQSFGLYEPFNPRLLSCEIGMEKPDPKAYEHLLAQLNLPAKDVVFIDDLSENVESAKKLGIDAILFESEEQLRYELSKRGVL